MPLDDQLIATALHNMNERLTDNHLEVVQRLTAIETKMLPVDSLAPRVNALESWRGKVTGGLAVISALISIVASVIMRKLFGK